MSTESSVIELRDYIGQLGLLSVGGLFVPVEVLDAKRSYGRLRFRVTPMMAPKIAMPSYTVNRAWVESSRVTLAGKG